MKEIFPFLPTTPPIFSSSLCRPVSSKEGSLRVFLKGRRMDFITKYEWKILL